MIIPAFFVITILRLLFDRFFDNNENLWYTQYYVAIAYYAASLLSQIGWSTLEPLSCTVKVIPEIDTYYHIQLGFYASSLFFLIALEKRNKDFLVMVAHHFVTLFLVTLSYWMNFRTVGFAVLFLHDLSDIFLYASKSLHDASKSDPRLNSVTYAVFAIFAVLFFITRLYVFPIHIIWSCCLKVHNYGHHGYAAITGLLALLAMHCYWFALILRMVWRLVHENPSKVEDVRE